jgi:hypothetical protein
MCQQKIVLAAPPLLSVMKLLEAFSSEWMYSTRQAKSFTEGFKNTTEIPNLMGRKASNRICDSV